MGDEHRFRTTRKILHDRTYRSVQRYRATFTQDSREKQGERDERGGVKARLRLKLGRLKVGVRTLQPRLQPSLDWENITDG